MTLPPRPHPYVAVSKLNAIICCAISRTPLHPGLLAACLSCMLQLACTSACSAVCRLSLLRLAHRVSFIYCAIHCAALPR